MFVNGNVGIGTTSPTTRLTVQGAVSSQGLSVLGNLQFQNSGYATQGVAFPAIASNTLNLSLSTASLFRVQLNSNITTLNFINPPVTSNLFSFVLQLSADGTPRAVTWPITVRWSDNIPPSITSTALKVDTFVFLTYDSGANYFGFVVGQNA